MVTPEGFLYRNLEKFGKQYALDQLALNRVL